MTETLTFIQNSITDTQKPINHENQGGESSESSAPADNFSFRRIEFHVAKKQFTGITNGDDDDRSFRLETLNPNVTSSENTRGGSESVGGGECSGQKRDGSEFENGSDQELSFGITYRRIGAGLENLGNTCFLNSVLQCLTYTEPLAAYLQSGKHQVTCRNSGFCALCAIQKHVSCALQLSGRSLAPKDLVSNLRCISRTFRNSRQEDAHEYMVSLLESMHRCCLPNGVPIESQSAYEKSLVHRIFGGQLRSQVKCMQCNYCSNKYDPFLDLSLEILNADTLYKAFANFSAKEQLDGGAKHYQCQQCKQKVKALKQLTVYKAPNVLNVHLKRFGCHISGQKIDKKVHFGPTLDLKPFVTGPYDGDLKYTLYGVLVHAGWSTHSGHYFCFVRTSIGLWYALDDNRVFPVSENIVFDQKAYMLFYFKDRKNLPPKKTTDAHQKEKIVMNGASNGPSAPRESQSKPDLSNPSLNAQTSPEETTDVAQQKENAVMNGTSNGPGAPRDAQMDTGISNGNESVNPDISLATVGTETSLLSHDAPKETQTNIIITNEPLSSQISLVSGAPKEAEMETSLSDESLNAQKSMAAVGIEGSGFVPVIPKETQTNSDFTNESLSGQNSLAIVGAMIEGFITGASEPERIQRKEISVPKSISEPSKTMDSKEEIDGGESSGCNISGDGYMEEATALPKTSCSPEMGGSKEDKALVGKTHNTDLSDSPQKGSSMETKASMGRPCKKVKNFMKCKLVSMKFSSKILMGTSLNQRKKKNCKRNKRVKNLAQEKLVNESLSLLVKVQAPDNGVKADNVFVGTSLNKRKKKKHKRIKGARNVGQESLVNEAQEKVKPHVDYGFKERVDEGGAVLATSDCNTGSQLNPKESNQFENYKRSLSQKDLLHMLTRGIDDRTVPRWNDEDESESSHIEKTRCVTIGYIGDEWDEEYDRGKRKKVRMSNTEFDGRNSFQDISNARLKSLDDEQNLSKMPPVTTKKKNKHSKKSGAGNGPYRI